jgi:hypothetical protein
MSWASTARPWETGTAAYRSGLVTYKQDELVKAIWFHFINIHKAEEPHEHQQKALACLPEAMRFPAIDPDAEQPENPADKACDKVA